MLYTSLDVANVHIDVARCAKDIVWALFNGRPNKNKLSIKQLKKETEIDGHMEKRACKYAPEQRAHTICPRSLASYYTVSCYIKLAKTSWIYSILYYVLYCMCT